MIINGCETWTTYIYIYITGYIHIYAVQIHFKASASSHIYLFALDAKAQKEFVEKAKGKGPLATGGIKKSGKK